MFERIVYALRPSWWNFQWSNYSELLNGKATSISMAFPLIGCAILFNDFVVENIDFSQLLDGSTDTTFILSSAARLNLMFFGMSGLACARFLYLVRRPHFVRLGETQSKFVSFALENFTFSDFNQLDSQINHDGHHTLYGKYYSDDWDAFVEDASWRESGQRQEPNFDKRESRKNVNFGEAKRRHEDLLWSILIDRYTASAASRRKSLLAAAVLAYVGYGLLVLPGIDLFARVVEYSMF